MKYSRMPNKIILHYLSGRIWGQSKSQHHGLSQGGCIFGCSRNAKCIFLSARHLAIWACPVVDNAVRIEQDTCMVHEVFMPHDLEVITFQVYSLVKLHPFRSHRSAPAPGPRRA